MDSWERLETGSARLAHLVAAYDGGLEIPLSAAERAALPPAMARQALAAAMGWVARLDDQAAARRPRRPRGGGLAAAHGRPRALAGRLRLTRPGHGRWWPDAPPCRA